MYKGVIFDLDGTLLNTLEDLADAGNHALSQQGLPVYDTDRYRYFVGNGIPMLIKRIMPEGSSKDALDKTLAIFSQYYEKHKSDKTAPYPGVLDMLDNIRCKNIKTAVVTNKADRFAKELISSYFGSRFDIIMGQKPGRPVKPNPFCLTEIQGQWGFEKKDILYIGDSGVDMETAKNGGFLSVGVLWGFRDREELERSGAVFLAESAEELERIIKQ